MKVLLPLSMLLLLLSFSLQAKCYQFSLKGEIKIINDAPKFISAEGTQSEVSLELSIGDILTIAPYVNRTVKINIISNLNEIHRHSKILKIVEIEHATHDPLNETGELTRKLIKDVACPL